MKRLRVSNRTYLLLMLRYVSSQRYLEEMVIGSEVEG